MNSLKKSIKKLMNSKKNIPVDIDTEQESAFSAIMQVAQNILESPYPSRIYDLIYTLGKGQQFDLINNVIKGKQTVQIRGVEELFFQQESSLASYSFLKFEDNEFVNLETPSSHCTLDPSKHIIFTVPWSHERIIRSFLSIGKNVGNDWIHQPSNHQITLIKPLNIGLVENGNHSSAMNIITNESLFTIRAVLDIKPIYNEIYTNGVSFKYINTDEVINKVRSVEMAAIFEIGRKISQGV